MYGKDHHLALEPQIEIQNENTVNSVISSYTETIIILH